MTQTVPAGPRAPRRPVSTWLRPTLQIAFVILAVVIGFRHQGCAHTSPSPCSFDTSCPFGGVATSWRIMADGVFLRDTGPSNLILLGLLLLAALLTGRAFCGWACPLGTVQDWLATLARRLTGGRKAWLPITPPRWLDRPLRLGKYLLLAWVIWQSATALLPPLQPFCPYRTLFTLNTRSLLGWSILVGFIVLSLVVERFWCRYLCPLGALLALTNKISLWHIRADQTACIACGRCDRACPMGLDVVREVERGLECTRCRACVQACPKDQALS